MAVNGRAKGASFERTVAKLFSEALGVKLRRTPLSGGWSHDNPDTAGDLVCVEGDFLYCVECKCAEGWKLESLFTDSHKWFDNWWGQLMDECPSDKIPILVFSRARQPIFAAMRYTYEVSTLELTAHKMIIQIGDTRICVTILSDLLNALKLAV